MPEAEQRVGQQLVLPVQLLAGPERCRAEEIGARRIVRPQQTEAHDAEQDAHDRDPVSRAAALGEPLLAEPQERDDAVAKRTPSGDGHELQERRYALERHAEVVSHGHSPIGAEQK